MELLTIKRFCGIFKSGITIK